MNRLPFQGRKYKVRRNDDAKEGGKEGREKCGRKYKITAKINLSKVHKSN